MSEDPCNIRLVCDKHGPKKLEGATKIPLKSYVGKYVKKSFNVINQNTGNPTLEHMWVKVKSVEKGQLLGFLYNDPHFKTDLRHGSIVLVKRSEILEVLDGP